MNNKILKKVSSGALLCTILAYTAPVFAFTKEETVYSKLGTDGSRYNTIVNDHIKNEEQEKLINDISDLLNIKNTNGDEKLEQDGNKLVWSAEGSDIYYQGESQKELPIECNVKYELNGKEISAKELAGKSGKVKITIKYTNKDEHIVNINGKNEKMYTPFVVVCGTIIKNESNKNIKITNGKLVDDGSKTTAIGISLPGLKESLNVSTDKIDIPDTIEITMDTTDFELNNIVAYVTPKVIEEDDLKIFDEIDEIYRKIDELQSSSKKIEDGATKLSEGAKQVSDNMPAITDGAKQLASGGGQITNGLSQIKSKLPTESQNKENESKLNYVKNNNETAVKSLNNANTQIDSQVTQIQQKKKEAETKKKAVLDKKSVVGKNYQEAVNAYNNYNGQLTKVNAGISTVQTQLNVEKDEQTKVNLQAKLAELQGKKASLETIVPLLQNQINALKGTVDALDGTITAIDGTVELLENTETSLGISKEANLNLSRLISGNNQVVNSSINTLSSMRQLSGAVNKLSNGSEKLTVGANTLAEGSNQMGAGTKQVSDGANSLAKGITRFNREGIDKICDFINGDIKDLSTRLEKLQELSKEYNNFTMLNDGSKGNVKFIMIMDSIKKDEDSKEEAILDNESIEVKEQEENN